MLLLKNCFHIATFNDVGDELRNHDILIRGNVIAQIAPSISLTDAERGETEVIDCSRLLVIPGLVNTHHHLYQILTRNLPGAQDAKLFDWLKFLYPIWANLDEDAVYYSTLLGTAELLKTGATCTTDHLYLYPRGFRGDMMGIQFEAAAQTGIRFSPARGSMTRGESQGGLPPDRVVQSTDEVLRDMARVVETFHDPAPLAMRKVTLAPCSPFSVEESVMVETAKLARAYGVILHTHLVETMDEEEYCLQMYGARPLGAMERWGWLGPDVYFAHGIWFDDRELAVLQETRTGVAHCPSSNMRLGSGIARIKEMRELGIRVGLAVDGSASNDSSDMLGEVRNAMLLQRVRYGSDALSARAALALGTRGGADLLGFGEALGRIEVGCGADLALFDLSQLQYAGALADPVAAIVFCGYNHGAAYTVVNGQVVVRDGKLAALDEVELTDKVNQIAQRLIGPQ
jgi:cytosine/adenosine deaminase-related metal-dependent hydrolase